MKYEKDGLLPPRSEGFWWSGDVNVLVLVDELRSSEQRKHVEPIVQAVADLHFSAGFVKKQVFLWDHEHFY